MSKILPIPTEYRGCNFRSRLEARWAVFFTALGLVWEYEPEGFYLQKGRLSYLPDFRITVPMWAFINAEELRQVSASPMMLWFEVKPLGVPDRNDATLKMLAFIKEMPSGLVILRGRPHDGLFTHYMYVNDQLVEIEVDFCRVGRKTGIMGLSVCTGKTSLAWFMEPDSVMLRPYCKHSLVEQARQLACTFKFDGRSNEGTG